jgi:hypothetical protein
LLVGKSASVMGQVSRPGAVSTRVFDYLACGVTRCSLD